MPSVTEQLATEVCNTEFADVPEGAVERLTRLFVDHVGIAYMGYRETGSALVAYAADIGGTEEAVLLGTEKKVPCELAAALNAQIARNTDFEDTGPGLHPGPVLVHTALAVGQRVGASGQQAIAAMALGHEFNCRFYFNSRLGPDIRHANMVAAAVSARLLNMDVEGVRRALSLAWEFPIKTINYTRPKVPKRITALGMGNIFSVRAGVQAALMAMHGFESVEDEIDQLSDEYNLEGIVDSSNRFHHAEHNIFLKPWPTSHGCHMVVHLIEELVEQHGLAPNDIRSVEAGLPDVYLMPHQNNAAPERYWEAIYSTAWSMAMVIHRVPPGPQWFTPERIADPQCRATAAKIEIVEHPPGTQAFKKLDLPSCEGWVRIDIGDRILEGKRTMAETYGSPTRPMPKERFEEKFMGVVAPSLGEPASKALFNQLSALTHVPDLNTLQPYLIGDL